MPSTVDHHSFSRRRSLDYKWITLPQTNIAPKNGWLEYYFPIGEAYFQVLLLVSGRVKTTFQVFFNAWVEKTSQDVGYEGR